MARRKFVFMSQRVAISDLGPRRLSPLRLDALGPVETTFILDEMHYLNPLDLGEPTHLFERAGPRETLFFDPGKTKVAIVTCGGLCAPG